MVKIIARRPLGSRPVYDIGLAQDHNFLTASGLVAANCFNKSHSTAYGFVTYQTAYLKANYPTEYMAALLSSVGGDQDKVQKYIAYCLSVDIQVQPPDINQSELDFTPLGKTIVFGLGAIKNVGESAIQAILEVRRQGGKFTSLADFCQRVDSRAVNKRAIEALIGAGAFDSLGSNRRQMIAHLETLLTWAAQQAKSKAMGQASLFDLLGSGGGQGFSAIPPPPAVPDFEPAEKLKLEKELLGFYVSDHPLRGIQPVSRLLAPVSLGAVAERPHDAPVLCLGLVTAIKTVTTKKGERMAIIQVEDLTGSCEAVVFPKTYERIQSHLIPDQRLFIWAKVDQRDEQTQLIVEQVQPAETMDFVVVALAPAQANHIQVLHRLQTLLHGQQSEHHPSYHPVIVVVGQGSACRLVRLGSRYGVADAYQTAARLAQAGFVAKAMTLQATLPQP
jgi:DNA polymerase-3 subunit alpha